MNMGRQTRKLIIALEMAAMAFSSLTGTAQTTTGQISGTVEDASGAVVVGASVQATNIDTRATRTVATGASGNYVLPLLPPGSYQVVITKPGFQSITENGIRLDVNQSLAINPMLKPGASNEIVEVQASSQLLDPTTSEVGTVIGSEAVNDLPLNGRNFTQLLTLVPGATPVSTSQGASQGVNDGSTVAIPGSAFSNPSLNGQQNRETLYLLDGVVNTDFRTTTYTVLPIIDGVSEFKVQTHNDDPSFGSVLGGVVNLVTSSGTNHLHGSAWEYVRNNDFDARNHFSDFNSDGSAAPAAPFHQNEFGVAVGGPVWLPRLYNGRNKTFFFFAFEGWRFLEPSNNLYTVPTAAEVSGDFSNSLLPNPIFDPATTTVNAQGNGYSRTAFPGNKIPADRINAQVQQYIQSYFDSPNVPLNSANQNEILRAPYSNNANNYQGRIDQVVTKKDTVFFRWSNMFVVDNNPSTNKVTSLSDFNGLNIGAGITHIFSPKLLLTVDGGRASRGFVFVNQSSVGLGPLEQEGFQGLSTFGPLGINLSSPYGGSGLGGPALRRNSSWSVSGQLGWQVGRHNFTFGTTVIAQYRSQEGSGQSLNFTNAQTSDPNNQANTGNSLASALLGLPNQGSFGLTNLIKYSIPTYGVFAGDSWKATPKLTLNFGVRYDHIDQPNLTNGINNGFNFETGNYEIGGGSLPSACIVSNVAPCIPGTSTNAQADLLALLGNDGSAAGSHIIVAPVSTRAPRPVWNNVGPRFGFAYLVQPTTVVRGGFGIVYDTLNGLSQTFSNSINSWPSNGSTSTYYNTIGSAPTTVTSALANVASPLTTGTPFTNFNFFYSQKYKTLYSEQWNLQVEKTVNANTLVSVGYVGSVSNRLDYGGTANGDVTPGPGTLAQINAKRPYPWMSTFVYDSTTGNANYHALQVKVQRRMTHGLEFLLSYTFSKSIDDTSGRFGGENGPGGNAAVQNYYDPASNRSVSAYNVPQFASFSVLYALPFGKGQPYFNHGLSSYVLGGWQINSVSQLGNGQAYTVYVNGDIANIGVDGGYERPNLIGNPRVSHPTITRAFNTAAFATPAQYTFGNVGRNSLRAENDYNEDVSLFKTFPIKDSLSFELRAEAFNVLNITNYGTPDPNLGDSSAGVVSSIANNPRQLQFAGKLRF
jgi:hypothetical protein